MASDSLDPIWIDLTLHRRQSEFVRRAAVSPTECSCLVAVDAELDLVLEWAKYGYHAYTYQAVELADGRLGTGLRNVPHLDAALAAGVHVLGGVRNGHSAHHFAVGECVDLACAPWNAGRIERVLRKRYRLQSALAVDVKGVGTEKNKPVLIHNVIWIAQTGPVRR